MDSLPSADELIETLLRTSDETDPFTRFSNAISEFQSESVHMDVSTAAYSRWLSEITFWVLYKILNGRIIGENDLSVKRDDRLTDAACLAVYKSFQLVMEQAGQLGPDRHFSAENTIQTLCQRVLASVNLLCRNMSIENSQDAIHWKNKIRNAADLAKEYINLQTYQLPLPEDTRDYDSYTLKLLQGKLMPKPFPGDTASHTQCAIEAVDADLVGLGGDLLKIKERLTANLSKLGIIQILGMGGIGKTTLTRRVYEDPQIRLQFHVRAWATVSQDYCERDVLLGLLQSIVPLPEQVYKEDKGQLAQRLYRSLKGRRYFIVIDDIWTKEAWDDMKLCFPDDNNDSRIILTSRLTEVATYVDPESHPHFMNFLGLEDSWELLHKNVFGKQSCPPQLVNVGQQIAGKCHGLPLAVKVIAGHLSKISPTKECWEAVAEKVSLSEVTQIESLLNILSLSYNNMPRCLKACFLTMVTFPKNFEIPVKKLIRLWTAMGVAYSDFPDSSEEEAMKCFEDLIGRSLIMVRKRKIDGKVKSCGLHDLLWDLGIREARKEGEYIFGNTYLSHPYFETHNDMKYMMGLSSTLLYLDHSLELDVPLNCPEFKLLRVLDILNQSFNHFPDEVTNLGNLRYLALATTSNIPRSVSKLSKLETFINNNVRAGQNLPKEMWLLGRLRHLHVGIHTCLSDPISALPDLQELSFISASSCTEEVLSKVPNLIELRINHKIDENMGDDLLFTCLNNLVHLQRLEKLVLYCTGQLDMPTRIPQWDSILPNIQHLTLCGTCLPWNEMNGLARLPNLEVLKLKRYSFLGEEWEMYEEFLQLKCLQLESLDLVFWKANQEHFPNLQCLVIRNCLNLTCIPYGFGEISALHLIDLEYCNSLAFSSARVIQREQQDLGNDNLIVRFGRMAAEEQMPIIFAAFIYLTLRSKMLWAKQGTDIIRSSMVFLDGKHIGSQGVNDIISRVSESPIVAKGKKVACDTAYAAKKLLRSTGKAAWITATTFLVLGLPLIVAVGREQLNELDLEEQYLLYGRSS